MWHFGSKLYKIGAVLKAYISFAKANLALGIRNFVPDLLLLASTITLPQSISLILSFIESIG